MENLFKQTQAPDEIKAMMRVLKERAVVNKSDIQAITFMPSKQLDQVIKTMSSEGLVEFDPEKDPEFGGTVALTTKGLKSIP